MTFFISLTINFWTCLHCIRFVHDIGGKCYLLLEGLQMREEEEETMVDEAELSNQAVGQAVGVGDIQNFFSALKTNDFFKL